MPVRQSSTKEGPKMLRQLLFCCLFVWAAAVGCNQSRQTQQTSTEVSDTVRTNQVHLVTKQLPPVVAEDAELQTVVFPIQNDSGSLVKLLNVVQSCSCAGAKLSDHSIGPGETATLEMSVDLRRRYGPQRITCTVIPDRGKSWQCEILTHVYQRNSFLPNVLNMGEVPHTGKAANIIFNQIVPDAEEFPEIKGWHAEMPELEITSVRQESAKHLKGLKQRNTHLTVRVNPRHKTTGDYHGILRAVFDGEPSIQPPPFYVTWRLPAAFEVFPSRLFITGLKPQEGIVRKKLIVRPANGQGLKRVEANFSISQIGLKASVSAGKQGGMVYVVVEINPSKLESQNTMAELVISAGEKDSANMVVPVTVCKD